MSSKTFSVDNLKRAIAIAEQIEKLEAELASILSTGGTTTTTPKAEKAPATNSPKVKKGKRTMSPEGRARIAAAQKARWAKVAKR